MLIRSDGMLYPVYLTKPDSQFSTLMQATEESDKRINVQTDYLSLCLFVQTHLRGEILIKISVILAELAAFLYSLLYKLVL